MVESTGKTEPISFTLLKNISVVLKIARATNKHAIRMQKMRLEWRDVIMPWLVQELEGQSQDLRRPYFVAASTKFGTVYMRWADPANMTDTRFELMHENGMHWRIVFSEIEDNQFFLDRISVILTEEELAGPRPNVKYSIDMTQQGQKAKLGGMYAVDFDLSEPFFNSPVVIRLMPAGPVGLWALKMGEGNWEYAVNVHIDWPAYERADGTTEAAYTQDKTYKLQRLTFARSVLWERVKVGLRKGPLPFSYQFEDGEFLMIAYPDDAVRIPTIKIRRAHSTLSCSATPGTQSTT